MSNTNNNPIQLPELKPSGRIREYNQYSDEIKARVLYEHLLNGKEHRWLDINVLEISSGKTNGRNSANILYYLGLKANYRGLFKDKTVAEVIKILSDHESNYLHIIRLLKNLDRDNLDRDNLDSYIISEIQPEIMSEETKEEDELTTVVTQEFDFGLLEKELLNKGYHSGKVTKYYILTVKVKPVGNNNDSNYKYLIYIMEDDKLIQQSEITRDSKNILTIAKLEGIKMLHSINPLVSIENVTLVNYKQDRNNEEPWDKDSSKILKELFEEYSNNKDIQLLNTMIDDIDSEIFEEGAVSYYYGKRYERRPENRANAIRIHGLNCKGCGFSFAEVYGERGKDFIEIHHIKPLSLLEKATDINPETDLVPLCSNCHRIVHRKKDAVLSIEELKRTILGKFKFEKCKD